VDALGNPIFLATRGKQLVETPTWTFNIRAQYELEGFTFGLQGKYTGRRMSTDLNDETSSPYLVADLDVSYNFSDMGWDGSAIRFNVTNLFDKNYLGSISSTNTAAGVPFYTIGSPRTFQVSLSAALP